MSDTTFPIQNAGHAALLRTLAGTMDGVGSLVREWWRRYRSRFELSSYSYDQRKEFGFSADVDAEMAKPFWKK
jgi:uncharacterized protein YjiS (DUF1127 family)